MKDIFEFDSQNMFQTILSFPEMLEKAIQVYQDTDLHQSYEDISQIVYCGMGGSGISGDILKNLLSPYLRAPFEVIKGYDLPAYVNQHSLILACSYSGNTEETLTALEQALNRGAHIFAVTSNGTLKALCNEHELDFVEIPGGYQPRASLGYLLTPFLLFLQTHLPGIPDFKPALKETITLCQQQANAIREKPLDNPLAQMANQLKGTIPIIYGSSGTTAAIAYRLKCQICENAKSLAFTSEFPELNHNEIVGWENVPTLLKNFSLIMLQDHDDHPRIINRQQFTIEIIKDYPSHIFYLEGEGQNKLTRWLTLIFKADLLSFYLAYQYDTDPTPIPKINLLKKKMESLPGKK